MHWIGEAAARAGLKGASTLLIPQGTSNSDAWEIGARALGTTPNDLANQIAPVVGLRAASLGGAENKALRLVPEKLARRYNVLPIRETDRQLTIATADPHNIEAEQAIAFASGRRVSFELCPPALLAQAINNAYNADRTVDNVLAHLDAELTDVVKVVEDLKPETVSAQDISAGPVVKLTNLVLRDAVLQRASDIHIEPGEDNGIVRFRIDGVMRQHMQLPMAALNRVVSRVKVLARLDIADRVRPQDGRSRIEVEGRVIDLRISTVPIRDAEKVVIRVLRPDANQTLEDIGIAPTELARLRKLMAFRDGIVLVTGPTGSGKTTTMYAALRELVMRDVNIMTVEDPVEYQLPRISQIQADPKRGVTFASALRAILRQDPDVIFVGEIRDLETAQIAVQAAMTGHLVLATLHTNDAVSAVARLLDLGLDRAALAATIRGSLAQRLVRRICQSCAQPNGGDLTDEESRLAGAFGVKPTVRALGCTRCANTGYHGRLPINEVAVFTPQLATEVAQGAPAGALQRSAIAGGMRTLRTTAIERVALGQTTLSEIERVVGDVDDGASVETKASTSPTVFVVDDDAVQRLLLTKTLQNAGYRVAEAPDGADALRRLSAGEECGLVVTDLHMPQLDGDALLRHLRNDPRTAALPIIVLTGSDLADKESELIDLGADDYIRKPVDPPRFIARVRAALRRAS
jgi:type II secretory ATPase GspE/PulE/Tfp pilus assembly ATPase PilB-like protein/CheY-like chemotaxis protein